MPKRTTAPATPLRDRRYELGAAVRLQPPPHRSQARYRRHLENFHLHHMKEVVAILDRVVREEAIDRIVVACDEVARPLLMEQLPGELAARVIDVLHMDMHAPEHRVLADTLEALRRRDGETDAERVEAMLNAWRAGGLAVRI